jgi:hypothetical protein
VTNDLAVPSDIDETSASPHITSGRRVADDLQNKVEKWFAHEGFPLLRRGRLPRPTLDLIAVIYILFLALQVLLIGWSMDRSIVWNLIFGVIGVVLFLVLTFYPWPQKPSELVYLVDFTVIPVIPALVLGPFWPRMFVMLPVNVLLVFAWLALDEGIEIFPLVKWALGQTLEQLPELARVLGNALPILLLSVTLLFFTAEIWQVAGQLPGGLLALVLLVFLVLGLTAQAVHIATLVKEYGRISLDKLERKKVEAVLKQEQLTGLAVASVPRKFRRLTSLNRRGKVNVFLVLLFAQCIQIFAVCIILAALFVAIGMVAVPATTQSNFMSVSGPSPVIHYLFSWQLHGRQIGPTWYLLKMVALIGVFSYLYFVFYAATNPKYIDTFLPHIDLRVRRILLVQHYYRSVFWRSYHEDDGASMSARERHVDVRFKTPADVKAAKVEIIGRILSEQSESVTYEMTRQSDDTFSTSISLPAGSQFQYHYMLDGELAVRDFNEDVSVGDYDIEESVITLMTSSNH